MKWNLRMVAAQRDIWRPTQLRQAFAEVGFTPSLSKVAAMWSGKPISVRLDDLDRICAALNCTVAELMQPEPIAAERGIPQQVAAAGKPQPERPVPRPVARGRREGPRLLPPN